MNEKLFLTIVAALVCAYVVIRLLQKIIDRPIDLVKSNAHREIRFAAIMKSTAAAP